MVFQRQGRPPTAEFCVDCFRAGLVPPAAGEKVYGSYCPTHYYKRQKDAQLRKSVRKEWILGKWDVIPELARGRLIEDCRTNLNKVHKKASDTQRSKERARATEFEYACLEWALQQERRITRQEEDQIIHVFGGSRTGRKPQPLGPAGKERPATGPILLPDPDLRRSFRATMLGGPTTEGEPTFTEYYRAHHHREPPVEYLEVDPDADFTASDGRIVTGLKALEAYEELIKRDPSQSLTAALAEIDKLNVEPEDQDAYLEEGVPPDVNASLSEQFRQQQTERN